MSVLKRRQHQTKNSQEAHKILKIAVPKVFRDVARSGLADKNSVEFTQIFRWNHIERDKHGRTPGREQDVQNLFLLLQCNGS